jgi:hypothetical protein
MWELRAGVSLARQWIEDGKRSKARVLLGPMVRWFKADPGVVDLEEAQALLASLPNPTSAGYSPESSSQFS